LGSSRTSVGAANSRATAPDVTLAALSLNMKVHTEATAW